MVQEEQREPIDSNRSFSVMSTFNIVLAALETFQHTLDFKSSAFCFGKSVVGRFV